MILSHFSKNTYIYIVGSHNESRPMSVHKICCRGKIRKLFMWIFSGPFSLCNRLLNKQAYWPKKPLYGNCIHLEFDANLQGVNFADKTCLSNC